MEFSPHLTFDGLCREAFTEYQTIFGGELQTMLSYGESELAAQIDPQWHQRIVHATLRIGEMELTGVDLLPHDYQVPRGFFVTVSVEGFERGREIFQALSRDGVIRLPYGATFWSSGFGVLVDRFGIPWEVNNQAAVI